MTVPILVMKTNPVPAFRDMLKNRVEGWVKGKRFSLPSETTHTFESSYNGKMVECVSSDYVSLANGWV